MLIIEEGADGEWGAASMAAGGMLGHSYPVATVMQAGDGRPGLIQHSDVTWQPEHPAHAPTQNKPNAKMAAAGNQ